MERQLLDALYHLLCELMDSPGRPGAVHSDVRIVATYLWSVLWDRPISWACREHNWPAGFFLSPPPSPPTMTRRLRTSSVLRLLIRVLLHLQSCMPASHQHYMDSRPLCVGGSSGDRDAAIGWGAGRLAKGYKLHAIVQSTGRLESLVVLPMNCNDTSAGPLLLEQLGAARGYLVGDTAYDATRLYDMAAIHGLQLVATPRVARKGLGHQKPSPHRLAGLAIARSPQGRRMLRQRFAIDRCFGYWGNVSGGLWGLPNFVRHRDRVSRWVVGKIILISLKRQMKSQHLDTG